jgi:hypothetical protein
MPMAALTPKIITSESAFRRAFFEPTANSPVAWYIISLNLKTAADRLNWLTNPIREEEQSLGLSAVYRMLIGMATEAMLKGIIVAQTENVIDSNRALLDSLKNHKLDKLAQEITNNDPSFVFLNEEINTLKRLRPYIEWAGRYPIPLNENQYTAVMHSNVDMDLEIKLWERLRDHLKSIGWVVKGKNRLYLTPRDDSTGASTPSAD